MKLLLQLIMLTFVACQGEKMDTNLTQQEYQVLQKSATEYPGTGFYNDFEKSGTYKCRQCGTELFTSHDKFSSSCGWPSFDDAIEGKVATRPDGDRTEIVCANCGGHLGHIFEGELLTPKNRRYCVNSLSLAFEADKPSTVDTAYFAGGCFWGVAYYFEKVDGVIDAISGYMGGTKPNPTYKEVSTGKTGYIETVAVTYDPQKVTYEELAQLFFEIHDPTQANGQGPDIGSQYLSAVFVHDDQEKLTTQSLINRLKLNGYDVVTSVYTITDELKFYPAESYHQDYYIRRNKTPYCHARKVRF